MNKDSQLQKFGARGMLLKFYRKATYVFIKVLKMTTWKRVPALLVILFTTSMVEEVTTDRPPKWSGGSLSDD
jgi:hypothetical protein